MLAITFWARGEDTRLYFRGVILYSRYEISQAERHLATCSFRLTRFTFQIKTAPLYIT